MSKPIAYEMSWPEVGYPMTDAVLCPSCMDCQSESGKPLTEVSYTRYCDRCGVAIFKDPPV